MRNRAFRPALKFISLLLVCALPAQAGPVQFGDVVHILSEVGQSGHRQDLKIRSVNPTANTGSTPTTRTGDSTLIADLSLNPSLTDSNTVVLAQGPGSVKTVEQGDISGTICDCGEIAVPGGGFPFFALLPLAAVPFFFIKKKKKEVCEEGECATPTPTPTPTPSITPTPTPPPEVPEPGSLLLLGSGLAILSAGARRRYMKSKITRKVATTVEG